MTGFYIKYNTGMKRVKGYDTIHNWIPNPKVKYIGWLQGQLRISSFEVVEMSTRRTWGA